MRPSSLDPPIIPRDDAGESPRVVPRAESEPVGQRPVDPPAEPNDAVAADADRPLHIDIGGDTTPPRAVPTLPMADPFRTPLAELDAYAAWRAWGHMRAPDPASYTDAYANWHALRDSPHSPVVGMVHSPVVGTAHSPFTPHVGHTGERQVPTQDMQQGRQWFWHNPWGWDPVWTGAEGLPYIPTGNGYAHGWVGYTSEHEQVGATRGLGLSAMAPRLSSNRQVPPRHQANMYHVDWGECSGRGDADVQSVRVMAAATSTLSATQSVACE